MTIARLPRYRRDFKLLADSSNSNFCNFERETFKAGQTPPDWPQTRAEAFETELGISWERAQPLVRSLAPIEIDVLNMMIAGMKKQWDIARVLGMQQSSVSNVYRRAMDRLKFMLAPPPLPKPRIVRKGGLAGQPCQKCVQIIALMSQGICKQTIIAKKLLMCQASVHCHMQHMRGAWTTEQLYMTYKLEGCGLLPGQGRFGKGRPKNTKVKVDINGNILSDSTASEQVRSGDEPAGNNGTDSSSETRPESIGNVAQSSV
jgi:hypothetical protein